MLPTKDNLVAWGIIPSETQSCISRCRGIETAQHLFLHCPCFGSLWGAVLAWLGTSTIVPCIVQDHFFQFVYVFGGTRRRSNFMQLVWLCCVWVIWNERNNRIFKNKERDIHHSLEKIKIYSFRWMKVDNVNISLNFSYVVIEPVCLFGYRLITLCYGSLVTGYLVYLTSLLAHIVPIRSLLW